VNVLKTLSRQYGDRFHFFLVITGWTNIVPDVFGFDGPFEVLAVSELSTADPAQWTFPRMIELIPSLRQCVDRLKPDLIIYDFFSLEGYCVGKEFGIPVWCSIPAFLGPHDKQTYLDSKLALPTNRETWQQLQQITLTLPPIDRIEMISDGFHIPGDQNLVWSYKSVAPLTFMQGRHVAPYAFLGNLAIKKPEENKGAKPIRPIVYFSLGTVVMDNLWNQKKEVRSRFVAFFEELVTQWTDVDFDVVCVTRNKPVFTQTPSNWRLVAHADQLAELARASVFVTHGGSNSFHESLVAHVPMVVLPFFGDQPLVAERVRELGLGYAITLSDTIDTQQAGLQLNKQTVQMIDQVVKDVLSHRELFQRRFATIDLRAESFLNLIETI